MLAICWVDASYEWANLHCLVRLGSLTEVVEELVLARRIYQHHDSSHVDGAIVRAV